MPRSRKSRRRLSTPSLKLAQPPKEDYQQPHTDPTSPPETPTTSPPTSRKISLKPRHQPEFRDMFEPLARDPNIRPVGNGHQFSYQPSLGPEQLSPRSSPRSSASSSDPSEDSTDDPMSDSPSIASLHYQPDATMSEDGDDEESDVELSEADSSSHSPGSEPSEAEEISGFTTATSVPCNFIIEDIDPMDSDCEGLEVLHPTEIESNRSRSRSRHKDHLDSGMMHDLRNLNCSNEPSDHEGNEGGQEGDYECDQDAVYHRSKQIRKFRRMSMGSSFGKRTHSELSDSDDDGEALDVNDVGSSARRMRRKMHRTSLLFHDPPPARIEELEEPDSSEDEFGPGHHLARELPYWAMEIMEMDPS